MSGYHSQEDGFTQHEVELVEELKDIKRLVVHNDDVNTFDHVIDALVDICDHTPEQAEQCSMIIHFKGQASVRQGDRDILMPMMEGLVDRGIDATIE